MTTNNRKILLLGIAIVGTLGFAGPLLFTLISIFSGAEQAPAPAATSQNQPDPARTAQEIAGYQKILEREPNNPNALSNLASLYLQQFQFDKAIPLVERLANAQPQNPNVRLQLAQLYQVTGKADKAGQTYDKVLATDKNNVGALIGKGDLLLAKGNKADAQKLYTQAEKAAPEEGKERVREYVKNRLNPPKPPAPPPGAKPEAKPFTPAAKPDKAAPQSP
ncbi:MAG: tetratricopeptide repeat protein [Aphanocapsa lilacina HA4352-LM1]|jgi:tetratricopeptide (TPR) repeat protein|nr:tetratricopeptide repeat protein [Aphanocapsa lilacina HA4352-LM1]